MIRWSVCGRVLFPWFQDDESSPTTETYGPMLPRCDLAARIAAGNPDQLHPPRLKLGLGDARLEGSHGYHGTEVEHSCQQPVFVLQAHSLHCFPSLALQCQLYSKPLPTNSLFALVAGFSSCFFNGKYP